MKANRAFVAGVIGGAIVSVLFAGARVFGMPVNLEMILGTLTGMDPGPGTWLIGLALHLAISGAIAMLYAVGFERVAHRAGALPGVVFSLIHIVIAGLFLGVLPRIHPKVPEVLAAPGAFMANLGDAGVLAFVAVHVIYGAVVGVMYGPVVHPAAPTARTPMFGRRAAA